MTSLALRSLRHRPAAVVATFVAVLLGTALMASFATLVESAFGAHDDDRELLIIMGVVVGGWGALIVLFSVASTVGIVAEQRARVAALLRTIGATPRQARALIVYEAVVVALLSAGAGALIASIGGSTLFGALQRGHLITSASAYAGGWASLSAAAVVVLVGTVASVISSRRATRQAAVISLRQVEGPAGRLRWWRVLIGGLLVASGLASAIVTITVTGKSSDAYSAMQTSGSASIVVGVGLAILAPALLRLLAMPVRPLLAGSGSGYLAAENVTRRGHRLAGMLAPVIVLVSAAVGPLLMVGIDDRTLTAANDPEDVGGTITMINSVVIGMICLFAAIMVVNAAVAVVAHRRTELDRLWRAGATTGQLRSSVVLEAAIVAVIGIVFGLVGSTATAVPYSIVRHEGVVPNGQLWLGRLLGEPVVARYADTTGTNPITIFFVWARDPTRWRDFAFCWFSGTGGLLMSLVPVVLLVSAPTQVIVGAALGTGRGSRSQPSCVDHRSSHGGSSLCRSCVPAFEPTGAFSTSRISNGFNRGSTRSRSPGGPRSTTTRPSFAGSSETCTTAPRRGSRRPA